MVLPEIGPVASLTLSLWLLVEFIALVDRLVRGPVAETPRKLNLRSAARRVGVMHNLPAHIAVSFHAYLESYGSEYAWQWTPAQVDQIWSDFARINAAEIRAWRQHLREELIHEKKRSEREEGIVNGTLRPGTPYFTFDEKNKFAEL